MKEGVFMTTGLRIGGGILLLIGIWQCYAAFRYWRFIHKQGTKNNFSSLSFYSGIVLGIFAVIFGLLMLFDPMGLYHGIRG